MNNMENNKNKNDWFIANMSAPNNTLGDFAQEGLTPDNTQLLSKEDYKKNEKIQELFTNEEGKFDEGSFNDFYDISLQTFNTFAKDNYDKTILNKSYFGESNIFVPQGARRVTTPFSFRTTKNPFNDIQGIIGPLSKVESDLTIREIAQTQNIKDNHNDSFMDNSPNDLGFFKTASPFAETLVLAQYDEDGMHYDADLGSEVKHEKGEYKFNEYGKPYYETLNGREVYGKNVLSPWDVSTIDGSMADKWNFMSSDDKDKTVLGSVTKAAAYTIPYFIPGFGSFYTAMTLGNAIVTDLIPTLAKSGVGLLFNESVKDSDFIKRMNSLQGANRKWRPSVSDNAQQSMFNVENISTMMTDVFGQLAQQRAIAKIPVWLNMQKKEAQAFSMAMRDKSAKEISNLSAQYKKLPDLKAKNGFLRQHFGEDPKIAEMLNKWDLVTSNQAKALGVVYMAGISSTGIAEEAKASNLDERDTALMFLGTMAGMGTLMSKLDIGTWALKGLGFDEVERAARQTIKESINGMKDLPAKALSAVSANGDDVVAKAVEKSPSWWFRQGKTIGNKLGKLLTDGDYDTIAEKALAEGLEEVSEEALMDANKLIYNGLRALNIVSTDQEETKAFEYDDVFARYMMSAVGGALGGAIAGVQDKIGGTVHSTLPTTLKKEYISMMMHGYESALRDKLKKMHQNGELGSTVLTPIRENVTFKLGSDQATYKPIDGKDLSQNDFVFGLLNSQLDFLKKVIFQNGDKNLLYKNLYQEREKDLFDFSLLTPIQSDINELVLKIADEQAAIDKIMGVSVESDKKEEGQEDQAKPHKEKMGQYQRDLEAILAGENRLYYTQIGLFASQKGLHKAYDIMDQNDMAMSVYKKKYSDLTEEEIKEVDDLYDQYVTSEKKSKLLHAYTRFEKDAEITNGRIEDLIKYSNQRRALFENEDLQLAGFIEHLKELEKTQSLEEQSQKPGAEVSAGLNMDPKVDVERAETLGGLIDQLLDFSNKEEYINPEVTSYVDRFFEQPILANYTVLKKTSTDRVNTVTINKLSSMLREMVGTKLHALRLPENLNYLVESVVDFYSNTEHDKVTLNNLLSTVENFKSGIYTNGASLDEFITNNSAVYYDELDAESKGQISPESLSKVKALLAQIGDELEGVYNSKQTLVMPDGVIDYTPFDNEINNSTLAVKKRQFDETVASKKDSPIHDLIAQFTKIDEKENIGRLFETLNNVYGELEKTKVANEFILTEGITKQQLEYAEKVLARLEATLLAATNYSAWQPTDNSVIIGYNDSLNKVEDLALPIMFHEDSNYLNSEIEILKGKIKFLLALSEFNAGGSVRDAKHTGVRLMTLEVNSIAAHLEDLKASGFDISSIEAIFDNATQFSSNMNLLAEDEEVVVPYDDKSSLNIRMEKDQIEQALYNVVNSDADANHKLTTFLNRIKNKDLYWDALSEDFSFSSNTKSIAKVQQLAYVMQTIAVDPKKFYLDYYGDLVNFPAESTLIRSPYSPFYLQEKVAKAALWSIVSKLKVNDTYEMFLNKVLPKTDTLHEERTADFRNNEDLVSLHNSIFINGVPGAGKSTAIIKFLTKALQNYGLDIAVFAPYIEQLNNLKKSVETTPNYINQDKGLLMDLFNAIDPKLYLAIAEESKLGVDKLPAEATVKFVTTTKTVEEALVKNPSISKETSTTLRINRDNEMVKDFMTKFSKFSINSKIPNVILIDEATHISGPLLELFNEAVQKHNASSKISERISVVFIGDTKQSGAKVTYKGTDTLTSSLLTSNIYSPPALSQSLRSGNNLVLNNNKLFRAKMQTNLDVISSGGSAIDPILNLKYIHELGALYGHKVVEKYNKSETEELINNNKGSVYIVTESLSDELKLILDGFSDDDYKVLKPSQIQGLEADAVIIDTDASKAHKYSLTKENADLYLEETKDLYTLLTRARKVTLINKKAFNPSIMNLISDNTEVRYKNIALDEASINKFKSSNVNAVTELLNQLKDLPAFLNEDGKKTLLRVKTGIDKDAAEIILSAVTKQISRGNVEILDDKIPETDGEVTTYMDAELSLAYLYHEHLGYAYDSKDRLIFEDEYIDAGLLFSELHEGFEFGQPYSYQNIPDDLKEDVRTYLKKIKLGYTTGLDKVRKGETFDLVNYLADANVPNKLLKRGGVLSDINNFELMVMTKDYDDVFDMSQNTETSSKVKKGGYISYVVLVDPNSWNEEVEDYDVKFTVAALPNLNNTKIPAKVRQKLEKLVEKHETYMKDSEKASKSYFTVSKSLSSLIRLGNLPLNNEYSYDNYEEFLRDHAHLNMSEPFVIVDDSRLDFSATSEKVDQELADSTKEKKERKSLNGRTVIFVSDDLSIPTKDLQDRFLEQVAKQREYKQTEGNKGSVSDNNIRLVLLNTKGISFSSWVEKSERLLAERHATKQAFSKDEFRALSNDYAAARIIAKLILVSDQYYASGDGESLFLPTEVTHTNGVYDKSKTEKFIYNVNNILTTVIPAVYGKTYMHLLSDLSDKVRTDNINVVQDEATYEKLYKDVHKAVVLDSLKQSKYKQVKKTIDELYGPTAYSAAQEHMLAKELLRYISELNMNKTEISDYELDPAIDEIKSKINDNEFQKSALHNIIGGFRVAFYGGKVKMKDGGVQKIKSIFAEPREAIDVDSRNDFLKQMDYIFTYNEGEMTTSKLSKENKPYVYKPLFPDGIHANIIYKADNFAPESSKPLAQPYANSYNDLAVNVRIQEPKLLLNLDSITDIVKPGTKKGKDADKLKVYKEISAQLKVQVDNVKKVYGSYLEGNLPITNTLLGVNDETSLNRLLEDEATDDIEAFVAKLPQRIVNELTSSITAPDLNTAVKSGFITNSHKFEYTGKNIVLSSPLVPVTTIKDQLFNSWNKKSKYTDVYPDTLMPSDIKSNFVFDFDKDISTVSAKYTEDGKEKREILFTFVYKPVLEGPLSIKEDIWKAPSGDPLNTLINELIMLNKEKDQAIIDYIDKLKTMNKRENITVTEQKEISLLYLQARLKVMNNLDAQSKLKEVHKKFTENNKCKNVL